MPEKRHRILHCLRAPVGGLFRHVRDLARQQAALGHQVGVVCDANASDPLTAQRLAELEPSLSLGLHKVPMSREIGLSDLSAARAIRKIAAKHEIDVIHGHGAKGGAYARYAARSLSRSPRRVVAFYTPHGGSLHYDPASVKGRAFMAIERRLLEMTDGIIFESSYAARTFDAKIGQPICASQIIHNGLLPEEFDRVEPAIDAADFVFIGELRHLKGVDLLLEALAQIAARQRVSAAIVGAGPDAAQFHKLAGTLNLEASVKFHSAMPAKEAFRLGRILVMPSRAESLPYIALEAAGAGLPLIASNVGGMPEIVTGSDTKLVVPDNVEALAAAMQDALASGIWAVDRAARLRRLVAERFSVATMTKRVIAFYAEALGVGTLEQMAATVD